jgi:hypothetical protein
MRLRTYFLFLCLYVGLSETVFAQFIMFTNDSSDTKVCIVLKYFIPGRPDYEHHRVAACTGVCRVKFVYSAESNMMDMIVVLEGESSIHLKIAPTEDSPFKLRLFTNNKKRVKKFDSSNRGLTIIGGYVTTEKFLEFGCNELSLKPGGIIHLCKKNDGTYSFTNHICLLNTMKLLIKVIKYEELSHCTIDFVRTYMLHHSSTEFQENYSALREVVMQDLLLEDNPPKSMSIISPMNERLIKEATEVTDHGYGAFPVSLELPSELSSEPLSTLAEELLLPCESRDDSLIYQFTDDMNRRLTELYASLAIVPYKPLKLCGAGCGKSSSLHCPCNNVFYCGKVCQKKDWRAGHKLVCTARKKGSKSKKLKPSATATRKSEGEGGAAL